MKKLILISAIIAPLFLTACSEDDTAPLENIIPEANKSVLSSIELNDENVASEFEKLAFPDLSSFTFPDLSSTSRKTVTQQDTAPCDSGNIAYTLTGDDSDTTKPFSMDMLLNNCQMGISTATGSLNSVLTPVGDSFNITFNIDLNIKTSSINEIISGEMGIAGEKNGSLSYNYTITDTIYGKYTTKTTTAIDLIEMTGAGEVNFSNDSIHWQLVANGIDITLESTGTTVFVGQYESNVF